MSCHPTLCVAFLTLQILWARGTAKPAWALLVVSVSIAPLEQSLHGLAFYLALHIQQFNYVAEKGHPKQAFWRMFTRLPVFDRWIKSWSQLVLHFLSGTRAVCLYAQSLRTIRQTEDLRWPNKCLCPLRTENLWREVGANLAKPIWEQ